MAFLQAHQPLPDDDGLEQRPELLQTCHEVLNHLRGHPDPRCVPLLLRSFGGWNGFGLYQTVEQVLNQFDEQLVVAELHQQLAQAASLSYPTLFWQVQMSIVFPHACLFDALAGVLNHPISEIRAATAYALSSLEDERVIPVLQRQLEVEDDGQVIEALRDVLEEL